MSCPATTVAGPVWLTDRSARSSIGSMSVAMAWVGSDAPAAGTTRAVFSIVLLVAESTVPVAVNVAAPATGTVTIALMLPVPAAAPQTAPPVPAQLQLTPVRTGGKISVTTASAAVAGPALVTVIVYVVVTPATTDDTSFVLVIARSATDA